MMRITIALLATICCCACDCQAAQEEAARSGAGVAGSVARRGSQRFARYVTASDLGAAAGPLIGWWLLDVTGIVTVGLAPIPAGQPLALTLRRDPAGALFYQADAGPLMAIEKPVSSSAAASGYWGQATRAGLV